MTRAAALRALAPLALACACACPAQRPAVGARQPGATAPSRPGSGNGTDGTPPTAATPGRTGSAPNGAGAGPAAGAQGDGALPAAGPAGPGAAGPAPRRPRIPEPEEGRNQLDLLPTRPLRVGSARLVAWIADREPSRRLGLMHVDRMPEDRGMLFVYPRAGRRAFWMRNTRIPLSLAYVRADGVIDQILDMEPFDLRSHPSRTAVQFVLEVNQGWFRRHEVRVGDRVEGLQGLRGH
ncbi:MAG: DUF192 domain-containing protein [Planctomycetota bacterium]|nr:MAG: DUF192 domain-containing protein [Planctomycetota bacterium]